MAGAGGGTAGTQRRPGRGSSGRGRAVEMSSISRVLIAVMLGIFPAHCLRAYSVLSHEAMIDALWNTGLRAALVARFPNATPEQLKEARSFAYGGAVIQDMGYYP